MSDRIRTFKKRARRLPDQWFQTLILAQPPVHQETIYFTNTNLRGVGPLESIRSTFWHDPGRWVFGHRTPWNGCFLLSGDVTYHSVSEIAITAARQRMDVGETIVPQHSLQSLCMVSMKCGDDWNLGAPIRLDGDWNWSLDHLGAILLNGLNIT